MIDGDRLSHSYRWNGPTGPILKLRQRSKEAPALAIGRLCFISSNLGGRSLARIVEEELIRVEIIDHEQSIAPRTLLDCNAPGLEFCAQRIQRGGRGCGRRRLDV